MEQTQNSFSSGLLMDTHPMLQGLDSLTDALNATFVTMNGNEIVLQNDMGNAKVQNAYLPQGYVPVGMKEYGGVIYVASYNPITDKGQIGSFPSPQRRFLDKNDQNCTIDFNNFLNNKHIIKRSILVPLKNDTIKNDTILRAGDKFVLYSDNISNLSDYITNYENVKNKYVYSPKNKYFTLSAGILNSKNEFVDITRDLARFDENGEMITEFENDTDLYKFNKGYFICSTKEASNFELLTSEDSELEKLRALDKLPLNTYAYKLVGPLYLKVDLNVPTDFDYSITAIKNKDNTYKFTLKGCLTYNCPDGVIKEHGENGKNTVSRFINNNDTMYSYVGLTDKNYYKYISDKYFNLSELLLDTNILEEGKSYKNYSDSFPPYAQIKKIYDYGEMTNSDYFTYEEGDSVKNFGLNINFNDLSLEEEINWGDCTYDYVLNLYKVKFSAVINKEINEDVLNYTLIPTIIGWDNDILKIDDLKRSGSLDLTKVGSGEMNLTAWRFYNDIKSRITSITYGFDAYPEEDHVFLNLQFHFYEATQNGSIIFPNHSLATLKAPKMNYVASFTMPEEYGYNGISDDILSWGSLLQERKLYQVIITWEDFDLNSKEVVKRGYDLRWLLTTPLFNDCYFQNSDKFITDFCNPTEDELLIYNSLVIITPELVLDEESKVLNVSKSEEQVGSLLYTTDKPTNPQYKNITYNSINMGCTVNFDWEADNYPDYIKANSPLIKVEVKVDGITKDDSRIKRSESELKFSNKVGDEYNLSASDIITLEDYIDTTNSKPTLKEAEVEVEAELIELKEYLKELSKLEEWEKDSENNILYCPQISFNLVTRDAGGDSTEHYIYVSKNIDDDRNLLWKGALKYATDQNFKRGNFNGASYVNADNYGMKISQKGDKDCTLYFSRYKDRIFSGFDDFCNDNFIILGATVFRTKETQSGKYDVYKMIWFRTDDANNRWVLYDFSKIDGILFDHENNSIKEITGNKTTTINLSNYFEEYDLIINETVCKDYIGAFENTSRTVSRKFYTFNKFNISPYYDKQITYNFKFSYD